MSNPALNAKKHGLLSEQPVIDGFETKEGWLAHRQAFWDDLQPEGAVQEALVERIALTFWRMARLARAEVAAADRLRDQRLSFILPLRDPAGDARFTLEEARAEVQTRDRLVDWLGTLAGRAGTDPLPAVLLPVLDERLLFAFESAADDLELDLEDPEALFNLARVETAFPAADPTVASLRALVARLAIHLECSPDRLLSAMLNDVREDAYGLSRALRETEEQVAEIRRTSQLPNTKELPILQRYDAHLGRELARLLRDLRLLRTPGSGSGSPVPHTSTLPHPHTETLVPTPSPVPSGSAQTSTPPHTHTETPSHLGLLPPAPPRNHVKRPGPTRGHSRHHRRGR